MEFTKTELRDFLADQLANYRGSITVISRKNKKEIPPNNFGEINIFSKFEDKKIIL